MSIRDEINHRVSEGRLHLLPPAIRGAPTGRFMYVGNELHAALTGPWDDPSAALRFGRLRADLDAFTEGRLVSIAEDPYAKRKSAYMARTDPISNDIWSIRSRDPRPAIRVLGAFAETDVFVALVYDFRRNLGGPGSREWRDLVNRCKTEWQRLFHPYPPHHGENLREYVSRNFFSV